MVKCEYCKKEIDGTPVMVIDEDHEVSFYCSWTDLARYCMENDPDMVHEYVMTGHTVRD